LEKRYGPVDPPEPKPVLDQLIATILSQNTSDANSRPAFEQLKDRFPDWDAARRARTNQIAAAIRRAGLANQKAPRIKSILQSLHQDRGELSLEFLRDLPDDEAIDLLTELPGVGLKTAACVLLFACDKPVLPVDTHVHRVARRLGVLDERTDATKAHEVLGRLVPEPRVLDFHVQLIRHGRDVCRARQPRCPQCPLLELCPEGHARTER
jgi:endonuclease-3